MEFKPLNEQFDAAPPETLRRVASWEYGRGHTPSQYTFRRKGL